MASVCSGAFLLAAAGILDGRRAATHWSVCDQLALFPPQVTVDRNAVFVRDGSVWTSAGVTTGIDMTLAMVENDYGRAVADAVAGRLVLYVRRPGFQSQFSDALVAQAEGSDPLGTVVTWARAHLKEADLERLARRSGLSARTFHRRCLTHLGTTPAKLLDKLRVEHARTLLAHRFVVRQDAGGQLRLHQRGADEPGLCARAGHGAARLQDASRGRVMARSRSFEGLAEGVGCNSRCSRRAR